MNIIKCFNLLIMPINISHLFQTVFDLFDKVFPMINTYDKKFYIILALDKHIKNLVRSDNVYHFGSETRVRVLKNFGLFIEYVKDNCCDKYKGTNAIQMFMDDFYIWDTCNNNYSKCSILYNNSSYPNYSEPVVSNFSDSDKIKFDQTNHQYEKNFFCHERIKDLPSNENIYKKFSVMNCKRYGIKDFVL